MRSTPRTLLVAVAGVALLAGCAETAPAQTAAPTVTPIATPTATPSPTPTPTPTATLTPTPEAAEQCADGVVVSRNLPGTMSWVGTWEEQVARSAPRPGFEPAELLAFDDVLCAVTFESPAHGESAVSTSSTAIVRDAGLPDAVAAWAAEHGYTADGDPASYLEYVRDPDPSDGVVDKIHWRILDDSSRLEAYRLDSGLDLQPTDFVLSHWHIVAQG